MKDLKNILKVRTQTNEIILLEVKPGSQMDLIENGFSGNERLFRIIKTDHGRVFSYAYSTFFGEELKKGGTYEWGYGGTTSATREWTNQRDKIVDIAKLYGFICK